MKQAELANVAMTCCTSVYSQPLKALIYIAAINSAALISHWVNSSPDFMQGYL